MLTHGHRRSNLHELQNWKLQIVNTDPGHTEGHIAYNTTDDRIIIGRTVGFGRVAYLDDLFGLNKWKYDVKLATRPGENLTLNGPATIDGKPTQHGMKVLVKNQTDKTQNGLYIVNHNGPWTRSPDADTGQKLEGCMVVIEDGTPLVDGGNKGTLWRNLNGENTITEWTTDIYFAQIELSVPVKDQRVKISETDTTEKFLLQCINNSVVTTGPATNNTQAIRIIRVDIGLNESIFFGLDLSSYNGDVGINGSLTVQGNTLLNNNLTVIGDTILSDLSFAPNSVVNWTNTTNTGTQNFSNTYTANYNGSTVNYNTGTTLNHTNVTENYSGNNTVNITAGSTYTTNVDGTVNNNYNATSVVNNTYQDGSVTNNTGTTTVNNTNLTVTENNTNVTTNQNNTNVVNNIDGTVTNNYSDTYVEYNVGGTVNNTNVTINNISNYTLIGCTGSQNLPYSGSVSPNTTRIVATVTYEGNTGVLELLPIKLTDTITIEPSGIGPTPGTFTATWNTNTNTVTVTQTAGSGTGTVDVCQYEGGMIINNNGTIQNNTNVYQTYDQNSTVINQGNVYNENLTVNNISYAESYVAGEPLTDRQPVRLGSAALGEDPTRIYGARATDTERARFIGFASRNANTGETLAVLQGPRVSGLKAVYGPLVDGQTYYLSDTGGISLTPGTVQVRLGDADGDDTLVGLNTPLPPAALVPPKQLKASNTWQVNYVPVAINADTFEWRLPSSQQEDRTILSGQTTYNAKPNEIIVVTQLDTAGLTIILPNATGQEKVTVKKITGEDVKEIRIQPQPGGYIDGYTYATMNLNRSAFTFVSVGQNNWYVI